MLRIVLLALALALWGGAPYAGSVVDLVPAWAATGSLADPDGVTTNAGNHVDPNGASAGSDAGSINDPNG
jgi:hypothetical protein